MKDVILFSTQLYLSPPLFLLVFYALSTFSSLLNSRAQLLKQHLLWDRGSINRPFLYIIDNNTTWNEKKYLQQ
jgi:hypothetical protein